MFSLILSLLVMALIGVVVFMGSYYMGDGAFAAKDQASAATVINGASQINGAIKLYEVQHRGNPPESLDTIVEEGYLKSIPQGEWAFADDAVQNTGVKEATCRQVNKRLHDDPAIPVCSESTDFMGCCSTSS